MNVAVLGAGAMGRGIARASARAGHEVTLRDLKGEHVRSGSGTIEALQERIDRENVAPAGHEGAFGRIADTAGLDDVAGADLVIEAVPRGIDVRRSVIADAERVTDGAVIASTASSPSLTRITSVLDDPARVIGLHFTDPIHLTDLVEVVVAERTAGSTVEFAAEFVASLEKETVVIADAPGFATSRLGVAVCVEAIRMVERGVAGPRAIDRAMELGYGHPRGPLALTDVAGLDVRLSLLEDLREELGERFRPPRLLKEKVRAGELGEKTGEGFYVWEDGDRVGVSGTRSIE
ncbi:3-hydroxyacyl-CoA dehydrogenase family protein [Halalkalicoccus sp. NIPERK01]|uniref:3-hydroxyacyl-CoA dehydrogenase family protein n=1 Tax=Halalkalicoccus sp. NIPERK01 TaxID=3053469 RepID=UPI00256F3850|nr:3-hydroxyacyl-CoA dehydrogenase family protein [Halalkalicoccus sp. NIPERK01]MDL5360776.1 3-hydroxyacyl-CoA dehydrogenase family protein [Halalkalicoccus sp. NIPERK01]